MAVEKEFTEEELLELTAEEAAMPSVNKDGLNKAKGLKIVIVSEFFPESESAEITGGVESRAFYAARELAKRNDVYVVTSRRPGSELESSFLGFKVIRCGKEYPYSQQGHLWKRLGFIFASANLANKLARKIRADIVDGYSFFTYPAALNAGLFSSAKPVLTYHEVWLGSWKKNLNTWKGIFGEILERKVLFMAKIMGAEFIAVSGFTRDALSKAGIDKGRIKVVHNGVNLSDYSSIRAARPIRPTVCFVGRLTRHKRVDDLLRAAAIVVRDYPGLKVLIVGDGPERKDLESLAERLKLRENVEFAGFLPSHHDVLKAVKGSTLFCSPSVVEGFGITLVEAIASGVPFVCSDIPPFKEITGGKGGLHFQQKSHIELAEKIKMLLKDKELYNRCVSEEHEISKRFGWDTIAGQIETVYSKLHDRIFIGD